MAYGKTLELRQIARDAAERWWKRYWSGRAQATKDRTDRDRSLNGKARVKARKAAQRAQRKAYDGGWRP